ncbi:ABC transporter permease [Leucobacter sp. HY1910]
MTQGSEMSQPDTVAVAVIPEEPSRKGIVARIWKKRLARPAIIVLVLLIALAVSAQWIAPHDPFVAVGPSLDGPNRTSWLGTDEMGRDILSRLLYGGQVSLGVAAISVAGALVIGMPIGLVAGFAGGKIDGIFMRVIDGMLAFPALILALALAVIIGEGIVTVVVSIVFIAIPSFARLVRAVTMQAKALGYVEASISIGTSKLKIAVRHIIPNIMGPLSVQCTLSAASAILLEASLSFLGVGIPLPNPSWGGMIKSAVPYLELAPAIVLIPGVCIFIAVMALNTVGDALRDALDARID